MSLNPPLYSDSLTPEWHIEPLLTAYPDAAIAMDAHVMQIIEGTGSERVWLVEHPPLYTAGTSANAQDLITPDRFPVFKSGRGGQYTYHGPGQRVVYPMLNLSKRGKDIRCYVNQLEGWIIDTLASFDVHAGRRDKRIGVWVVKPDGSDAKIAAIGVRIRRWVSFHGLAINVNPDLSHFSGIVPCGISEHGVTSLCDLGVKVSMEDVDAALLDHFKRRFGNISQS